MTVGDVVQRSAELIADTSAVAATAVQISHSDSTVASGDQVEFSRLLVVDDYDRRRAEAHSLYQCSHFSAQ